MRKLAYWSLMIFVFSIPWQAFVFIPGIGSISRVFGLLLVPIALLYILLKKNIKEPSILVIAITIFIGWGLLTYFWSIHQAGTLSRFITNMQILAMVWLIWELCNKKDDYHLLMQMYLLGLFIAIFDMLSVYFSYEYGTQRITAGGFNQNQIARYLALGIPLAWYLLLNNKKYIYYWLNIAFIPLSIFCIFLTGSRTGFIVGFVGLMIIPLTFSKLNIAGRRKVVSFLFIVLIFITFSHQNIIPNIEHNIERIKQTQEQIEGGQFSGRGNIWKSGLVVFSDNAFFGVGVGSYGKAITEHYGRAMGAHNTYLSVIVESGIIGVTLFLLILAVAMFPVSLLNYTQKVFYAIIMLTLLVSMIPAHLETDKVLWFALSLFPGGAFLALRNGGFGVIIRE